MFQRNRATVSRRGGFASIVLVLALASPAGASDAVLYRIFLQDGSTLVSYGEFARVAGRVVFSIPLSAVGLATPPLQLISISESTVDWDRTDRYAEAARAHQYADTRGEAEFASLSTDVAHTLNEVALTKDPAKRLALADQARRALMEWPSRNYGYRASDVAQLAALLDGVISELRVAAGQSRFDVALVAHTSLPPAVELLPPPTLRESIEQAFTAARLTSDSSERVAILRAISSVLTPSARDAAWVPSLRTRAAGELARELKADQAYATLASRVMTAAEERARRADVKGLEALVVQVMKADDRLGRARPQATAALLATLDARLDGARRLRLAHDAWALRVETLRTYEGRIRGALDQLTDARDWLEQIRQFSGPAAKALPRLQRRTAIAARELALVKPPPELVAIHGMLTSAFQMAVRAAETRGRAAATNDMDVARQASSAAAGAMLLVDRVREDLQRLMTPPVQ